MFVIVKKCDQDNQEESTESEENQSTTNYEKSTEKHEKSTEKYETSTNEDKNTEVNQSCEITATKTNNDTLEIQSENITVKSTEKHDKSAKIDLEKISISEDEQQAYVDEARLEKRRGMEPAATEDQAREENELRELEGAVGEGGARRGGEGSQRDPLEREGRGAERTVPAAVTVGGPHSADGTRPFGPLKKMRETGGPRE